jgi:hypothetical protein
MANHSSLKLGKRRARRDFRTLRLACYLGAAPAASLVVPAKVDYTCGVSDWGVMANDKLSCCTIAAVGHAIQTWRLNAGAAVARAGERSGIVHSLGVGNAFAEVALKASQFPTPNSPLPNSVSPLPSSLLPIPDSTIVQYYEQWDGYNPVDPTSDQGGVELDVLNDWRQQGFAGHTLEAFTAIDLGTEDAGLEPRDTGNAQQQAGYGAVRHLVQTAIWLFGGAYIGVELPLTAQKQDVWDVTSDNHPDAEPGSWGGHAVYVVGYEAPAIASSELGIPQPSPGADGAIPDSGSRIPNPEERVASPGSLTCITWGRPKKMTWAWFEKYCSEAYALISKDWIEASGLAPSGFDLAALENDLKLVTAPPVADKCAA